MRTLQSRAVVNPDRGSGSRWRAPAALLLGTAAFTACCATDKSAQLARVAKDWCLTIRASQVIPTYPLVEDLRPGDVFLTTTPIGEEVDQFESKGFLPLDNLLTRLAADDVFKILGDYYGKNVGVGNKVFPAQLPWDHVPDAKFPSYTFEASRTGGINLAIPIQAVPVGLNYLRSSRSVGSVTLSEAQTLGVPIDRLNALVSAWAEKNTALLEPYGSFPDDLEANPVFVRIVTRIYFVGKVAVHLSDTSTSAGEASAGDAPPLDLLSTDAQGRTVAERQQDAVEKLNAPLKLKFGGRVRIASATARSVTLDEDFERPVVVGYLAYDRRVLPGGSLGAPVSTLARVSGKSVFAPRLANFNTANFITAWYTKDEEKRVPILMAWITREYPDTKLASFAAEAKFEDARLRCIRELKIR
jgi:hypothetical protein